MNKVKIFAIVGGILVLCAIVLACLAGGVIVL